MPVLPPAPPHIAVRLYTQRTHPPRPFAAAQARTWHGIRRPLGLERATVTVTFHLKR